MTQKGEITELLAATRAGDAGAWDQLVRLVYGDLQKVARKLLRGVGRDKTLNTGALIHEYYLRLQDRQAAAPQDRNHFLSLAARVMRQVICDYARERLAQKRGGGAVATELDENAVQEHHHVEQFVELDAALNDLAKHNERQARVVECRFFGGLTDAETADALGISVRSVARDWDAARAWLVARSRRADDADRSEFPAARRRVCFARVPARDATFRRLKNANPANAHRAVSHRASHSAAAAWAWCMSPNARTASSSKPSR